MLKADHHKVRLSGNIRADISWWHSFMATFKGKSMLLDHQPIICLHWQLWYCSRGSLQWGLVRSYLGVRLAICGKPSYKFQGGFSSFPCSLSVGPMLEKQTYMHSIWQHGDCGSHQPGTSKNPILMACLWVMFWLSATYNFHIKGCHIRGFSILVADGVSHMHEPGKIVQVTSFLSPSPLYGHLSQKAYPLFSTAPLVKWRLKESLDNEVAKLRLLTFAESTRRTYST